MSPYKESAKSSPSQLTSEAALDHFLRLFEAGAIPKTDWTHAAHVTIGSCYALAYPESEALGYLRQGIRFLNECQGVLNTATSGYHETLTRFWLSIVRGYLSKYLYDHPNTQRVDAIRAAVDALGNRRALARDYYSVDIVASTAARQSWVAPDVQPLPTVVEMLFLHFRKG